MQSPSHSRATTTTTSKMRRSCSHSQQVLPIWQQSPNRNPRSVLNLKRATIQLIVCLPGFVRHQLTLNQWWSPNSPSLCLPKLGKIAITKMSWTCNFCIEHITYCICLPLHISPLTQNFFTSQFCTPVFCMKLLTSPTYFTRKHLIEYKLASIEGYSFSFNRKLLRILLANFFVSLKIAHHTDFARNVLLSYITNVLMAI